MEKDRVKKISMLDENELKDINGGRASNEYWTCPRCGQIVFCTKHLFYSKIEEHQRWHEEIDRLRNPNSENEDDENWRLIMPDPVNGKK